MRSGLRLIFTFVLVLSLGTAFAVPCASAAHRPKHSSHQKKKKHSKSKKKTKGKKKSKKKKKGRPKHAKHRSAPRPLAPNVVRAKPAPASPYSASPSEVIAPSAVHEVIPLHDPKAPVEEHSVQLDMTKPYGQATPASPPPGAERGLASEHEEKHEPGAD